MQDGPLWLFHSDFTSSSESAEIWHVYCFCVKKGPCFFFTSKASNMFSKVQPPPPPPPPHPSCNPPPPSNSVKDTCTVLWPSKIEILCCLETNGEGRGGWISRSFVKICLHSWKNNNTGTFLNTKRVDMPNFSRMWATWTIATKSSYRAGLHGATQFQSVPGNELPFWGGAQCFGSIFSAWKGGVLPFEGLGMLVGNFFNP